MLQATTKRQKKKPTSDLVITEDAVNSIPDDEIKTRLEIENAFLTYARVNFLDKGITFQWGEVNLRVVKPSEVKKLAGHFKHI